MNNNLTDITVVLDRSGSMADCRKDAEGGLNTFIKDQAAQPNAANFTLAQFDTEYEIVHKGVSIKSVPPFTLNPRGGTALLDAIGRTIYETGERLAAMSDDARPGAVIFAILTDGEENSSKEFTADMIRRMIAEQTEKYNWQFTYLGANQDAFAVASSIGIAADSTMNYSPKHSKIAFASLSANTSRMRCSNSMGHEVFSSYSIDERLASVGNDASAVGSSASTAFAANTIANSYVKDPAAVSLGSRGGLKGGHARANALTPEERSRIAKLAAEKRWGR